jgi:hypothetical protein
VTTTAVVVTVVVAEITEVVTVVITATVDNLQTTLYRDTTKNARKSGIFFVFSVHHNEYVGNTH